MMRQKIIIALVGVSLAFGSVPAHALRCEIFDLVNAVVTPWPVKDDNGGSSMTLTNLQQVVQTVEAGIEFLTTTYKNVKISIADTMENAIPAIEVPEIENYTKGAETSVDAFKGKVAGLEKVVNVDFSKPETTEQAVESVAVVANPVGNVEELAAKERKLAFLQKSRMELAAQVLYYKSQLEELKQSDTSAQGTSSSEDTAGSLELSAQMKDMQTRIQALQKAIKGTWIEYEALRNLEMADPIPEKINVGEQKA